MKSNYFFILCAMLICIPELYAQLGIKAGVNMANEIKSLSTNDIANQFKSSNLTGYQFGLTYQAMPKKTGLGAEMSVLLSQKGSSFTTDTTATAAPMVTGYREIDYVEVPLNLRYHFCTGLFGVYGFGGVYGGYALSATTVNETSNVVHDEGFTNFMSHIDYGFNVGAGIELFQKIQFGATWSQGVKSISFSNFEGGIGPVSTMNRVLSINLVYLFRK